MDDRLKDLMQELGQAINESLSDSERIAEAIGEIKRAGYDVFLVLEATIGFNKRDEAAGGDEPDAADDDAHAAELQAAELQPAEPGPSRMPRRPETSKFRWTSQDTKFLKALKISLDDDGK